MTHSTWGALQPRLRRAIGAERGWCIPTGPSTTNCGRVPRQWTGAARAPRRLRGTQCWRHGRAYRRSPSARPLLRCRSNYVSNPIQLHLSSRRVGAMGSARAGQLRGGANCRNHCEAARALSPSPEPIPAAAPAKPRCGSDKILYLSDTERMGRMKRQIKEEHGGTPDLKKTKSIVKEF